MKKDWSNQKSLLDGIKIINNIDNTENEYYNRVDIGTGYTMVQSKTTDDKLVDKKVYIANNFWRAPTSQECHLIYNANSPRFFSEAIEIFRASPSTQQAFWKTDIHNAKTLDEVKIISEKRPYKIAIKKFMDDITVRLLSNTNLEISPIIFNLPGLSSVTYYADEPIYAGLHFDFCDKLPPQHDALARNRLCLNIGNEDRFFVYHNMTRDKILEKIGYLSSLDSADAKKMVSDFFFQNQNYPLIKLRLRPFDSYIAPVERIMHEGYTFDMKHPDYSFSIRGYIGIQPSSQITNFFRVNKEDA